MKVDPMIFVRSPGESNKCQFERGEEEDFEDDPAPCVCMARALGGDSRRFGIGIQDVLVLVFRVHPWGEGNEYVKVSAPMSRNTIVNVAVEDQDHNLQLEGTV